MLGYGRIMANESVDSASLFYQRGFELSKKIKFARGVSGYYANATYLEGIRKKRFSVGLKLAKEYEAFAKTQKNDYFLAKSYFSHAAVFQSAGNADSAIVYYEKAIRAYEKVKDLSEMAVIYTNLSGIYLHQGLFDIGIQYGKKALSADILVRDTLGMISDNTNLSNLYFESKNFKLEELHIRESLRLSEKINSKYDIMMTCINMAEMFKEKNRYDSSIFYGEKAMKYAKSYGSDNIKFEILLNLTDTYMRLKQYKAATKYMESAIAIVKIDGVNLKRKLYFTELKINLFIRTGRYKEAAMLMPEFKKLADSSTLESTQEKVLAFDNKLKKSETEKLFLEKEVELNKQKLLIYGLSTAGIFLILFSFIYYRYQNKKQEAKSQQIKILEQENEFIAVKSSLEGQLNERVRISKEIHDDLGSSLTSISLLTEVLKTKIDGAVVPEVAKISATSARMVDAMNEIVWALNVQNDTLSSLVAFIRKYARDFLQNTPITLVFEENVNQDFTLQGNVRRSIYLVVKEAINNVVKHADAQKVILYIQVENNKLIIMIEDDGKGINEEEESVLGNGLRNMKQRMEDIGGTFSMNQTKGMLINIEYNFLTT